MEMSVDPKERDLIEAYRRLVQHGFGVLRVEIAVTNQPGKIKIEIAETATTHYVTTQPK